MNVLVIGGNRFVGYLAAWRLIASGARVTLLNRGSIADPFGDRVERLRGDRTRDFERLLDGRRFDAAIDFAAFQADDARQGVELLRERRLSHYVFISSGQVYLVRETFPVPSREEDYDGALMARPSGASDASQWDYGIGKRACEDVLAEAWIRGRLAVTSLRIPMVNGERDYARRIEAYLWRLLDGGPLILPDGGEHRVRHVYGADVARVAVEILGREATFGRAFNLAQDEMPTLRELVAMLAELLGARAELVDVPSSEIVAAGLDPRALSPFSATRWMSCLDPARAKRELAFTHEALRSYLGRIVASFIAHPPLAPPESYRERRRRELELAARSRARA